jgi:dTDP-4-dehydrorhamnose 3,5-epimerase
MDQYFNPADELGVRWDDPVLRIDWQIIAPILSACVEGNPLWANIPVHLRPK